MTLSITGAVAILNHLFRGGGPLPAPALETPWFEPTGDALSCLA